jgi:hypothetical protein
VCNNYTGRFIKVVRYSILRVCLLQGIKGIVVGAVLALAIFALVLNPVLSLNQTSTTISNNGSITPGTVTADYTITGTNGVYTGYRGTTQLTTGSDASTVVSYILSQMSAGQTVAFSGAFAINSGITVSKSVTLDFGTATIVIASSVAIGFTASGTSNIAFLNGDISGGQFAIAAGHGSSYVTIRGCSIHGQVASGTDGPILLLNNGYNQIINCTLHDANQLIYVAGSAHHNTISGTEFYNFGAAGSAHALYLDMDSSTAGYNEISNCKFHDPKSSCGAMVIKCPYNKIHGSQFYNFPTSAMVPMSIYSQYTGARANDNEFYSNNFTNCYYTVWIGGNPNAQEPQLRNKIHDNAFTSCTYAILLNFQSSTATNDTWIYYNKFISCTNFCSVLGSSNVANTVIAYNDFSQSPVNNKDFETAYTNTMVYGNTGLADFNVPSPLPIPPR